MTFEKYWATTGPWPNNILGTAFKEVAQEAWDAAMYARDFERIGQLAQQIVVVQMPESAAPKYPHCDQDVLHAPGECEYCDNYPHRQALRQLEQVNFTGKSEPHLSPCPSDARRGLAGAHVWGGNRPKKA